MEDINKEKQFRYLVAEIVVEILIELIDTLKTAVLWFPFVAFLAVAYSLYSGMTVEELGATFNSPKYLKQAIENVWLATICAVAGYTLSTSKLEDLRGYLSKFNK